MYKPAYLTFLFIFLLSNSVFAMPRTAGTPFNSVVQGLGNINNSISTDNYNPLTQYKTNDLVISFMPTYYQINILDTRDNTFTTENIDDTNAKSINSNIYYALNEYLQFSISHTYISMEGKVKTQYTKYTRKDYEITTFNSSFNVIDFGIGLDFINGSKWSLPITYSYRLLYTNIDYNLHYYDNDNSTSTLFHGTNNELITGYLIGIMLSRKFTIWGIDFVASPFLLSVNLNKHIYMSDVILETTDTNFQVGTTITTEGETSEGIFPGFNFSYVSRQHLSVGISISGLFFRMTNYYNDLFLHGLETTTYSLRVSYKI